MSLKTRIISGVIAMSALAFCSPADAVLVVTCDGKACDGALSELKAQAGPEAVAALPRSPQPAAAARPRSEGRPEDLRRRCLSEIALWNPGAAVNSNLERLADGELLKLMGDAVVEAQSLYRTLTLEERIQARPRLEELLADYAELELRSLKKNLASPA